jgi:hypothetical protein
MEITHSKYNAQRAALDNLSGMEMIDPPEDENWPKPMRDEAFYGLAGDFVKMVLPESEADPHALLLTLLSAMGCLIGRHSYYQVEDTRHYPNLFTVIVGDSAKARKGTATDRAIRFISCVDPEFAKTRKVSGLSSGEGLIHQVRDGQAPGEAGELDTSKSSKQTDIGVADKRLLVVESEFAHPLQASRREGSTISNVLRDAWDGKTLRTTSRSNSECCMEPHISVIGNITIEELQRLLSTNDRANGFANRFLWCCAKRSKELPYGGKPIRQERYSELVAAFKSAVEFARSAGQVGWEPSAGDAWRAVYSSLTRSQRGLHGTLTARAEAQCVRVAMLYALLDGSAYIRLPHLKAAVAVWEYCSDSASTIFISENGDPYEARILQALERRPDGLTKNEINRLWSGHADSGAIRRALNALADQGKIELHKQPTSGAPLQLFRLSSVIQ